VCERRWRNGSGSRGSGSGTCLYSRRMTGQFKTFIHRAASGPACAIAGSLLIGCATPSSAPPKSAAPAAASTASSGARDEASRGTPSSKAQRTTKASKAKPAAGSKKAQPRHEADRPVASVKPDRSYQRPAGGAVVARFDGRSSKGVDFAGAKGDPVRAAGDGKVVFAAATLRGYGRLVMIKHDATYMSAYAHNSELLVKEGQAVKRGQLIARMGDTESATVKLHFELRRNGSAIDPMPFFAAGGAGAGSTDD